jgi:hypothetical protein
MTGFWILSRVIDLPINEWTLLAQASADATPERQG